MVERNEDPTRGRKKKRNVTEIAEERRERDDLASEWTDKYGAARQAKISVHTWKKRCSRDDLPPAREQKSGWEWRRADISAMKEMERLGLWQEWWLPLRKARGEHPAWVAMLSLLDEAKTRLNAEADAALRLVREQRARQTVKQGGPF